jgi:hypothetical protein
MSKWLLRILQVSFTALAGLLIVPVAVNVGTGGTTPGWLTPFKDWLWPVAFVCVGLVIALEILDRILGARTVISVRLPNSSRNVDLALAQAKRYVELRQQGLLAERVQVALALDERPAAVRQPAHLVKRMSGEEFRLSATLGIADVFAEMDQSMLILGAPGAGKTTQLLDLASALITKAQNDRAADSSAEPPIPVILDLADWSRSGTRLLGRPRRGPKKFSDWLLDQLRDRYSIPERVARVWLDDDRFTVLFDGLDEVSDANREQCVRELNGLQTDMGIVRVAVCSRATEYDDLRGRLRLQGAVTIRPLTRDQVVTFLRTVTPKLAGIDEALQDDPELWDLLTSPLMLNIMAIAYSDRKSQALVSSGDSAERRRRLFDAYVVEVLARRRPNQRFGDSEWTLGALRVLANASERAEFGVRIVPLDSENVNHAVGTRVAAVQRLWLSYSSGVAFCLATAGLMSAYSSAAAGIIAGLIVWLLGVFETVEFPIPDMSNARTITVPRVLIATAWLIAVAGSLVLLSILLRRLIAPLAEQPHLVAAGITVAAGALEAIMLWPYLRVEEPNDTDKTTIIIIYGLVTAIGGLFALLVLLFGVSATLLAGWAVGVVVTTGWLAIQLDTYEGLRGGSPPKSLIIRQQGILLVATIAVAVLVAHSVRSPFWVPLAGFLIGIVWGYIPGIYGCKYLVAHVARPAMVMAGVPSPWRAKFLRYAVDRSILTWTDGEYRFVHLLVRDYVAACDPAWLAAEVDRRRVELGSPVTQDIHVS